MSRYLHLIILLCLGITVSFAQTDEEKYRGIYDAAENDYHIGRVEQAELKLKENIKSFPFSLRQSVFRLLSLCYLEMDKNEEAQQCAKLLLNENPYYSTTLSDPQRFIDMVESIKSGRLGKITTASIQSESIAEAPVPTTLITEEMIKESGARNLQELLAIYVPGMNIIDCNDDLNISMRGVYSHGQEKILFMLNGHTLNSYSTNIAAPDFSIGLEKLKQIEVLRGPSSSLYGNVALTAVVNLITKQGADVDGFKVKAGIGNYGQYRGDAILGKKYFDLDLLIWGSFYKAKGEELFFPKEMSGFGKEFGRDGTIVVGAVGSKPSYDYGTSIKYKDVQFFYNCNFSQIQSPLTYSFMFSPYDRNKYNTYNGIGPSFTTMSHHAHLSYGHQFNRVFLKGSILYDNSDMTHYQVISDYNIKGLIDLLPLQNGDIDLLKAIAQNGFSRYMSGQERTYGGKLQGDWEYVSSKNHKGLLTFGTEYSYFQLDDASYSLGFNFIESLGNNANVSKLGKGYENNYNTFIQLKHQWRSFIINSGLRFDYKYRYDESQIKEFSPRISLIYVQPKWNLKFSYSKAFIDAPYFYRKTNLFLLYFLGHHDLSDYIDPESLHSYQLTFGSNDWIKGLNFEVNAFFNSARDLITQEMLEHSNGASSDIYGLEFSGRYERKRFSANLVAAWIKSSKYNYNYYDSDVPFNTPEFSANAVLTWKASKRMNIHSRIGLFSKQTTRYLNIINSVKIQQKYDEIAKIYNKYQQEDIESVISKEDMAKVLQLQADISNLAENLNTQKEINPYFIVDLGANYKYKNLELGLNIYNLLNKEYSLSGANTGLIPQKGRWFLFDIAYKF